MLSALKLIPFFADIDQKIIGPADERLVIAPYFCKQPHCAVDIKITCLKEDSTSPFLILANN